MRGLGKLACLDCSDRFLGSSSTIRCSAKSLRSVGARSIDTGADARFRMVTLLRQFRAKMISRGETCKHMIGCD